MVDAIIFDLDGTLWSSVDTCLQAWNQVLTNKGYNPVTIQQLEYIQGIQHDKVLDKIFPGLANTEKQELLEELLLNEITFIREKGGKLYNNTLAVLNTLSIYYPLLIVSNCQKGYLEAFFDYFKLGELFIGYEYSGNTGRPKAHNLKLVVKRYRLKKPVYIGDTAGDQQASLEAGIPFIYSDYGFGRNVQARYQISDLEDLIETDILASVPQSI